MRLEAGAPQVRMAGHPQKTPGSLLVLFIIAVIVVIVMADLNLPKTPVRRDFGAMVRERSQVAKNGNRFALDLFRNEVERAKTVHHTTIAISAQTAAKELATYPSIGKIVYFLARDTITGENKAEENVNATVAPILDPSTKSLAPILDEARRKLDSDLRISTTRLAYELAAIADRDGQSQSKTAITPVSERDFQSALRALGVNAAWVGVAAPVDGYALVRLGPVLGKKLTATAGRMFGKQVTRLAGSGTLAVMDGPLPVGDILALVTAVWTAYDIHSMKSEFRSESESALLSSLSQATEAACNQAIEGAIAREQKFAKLQAQMVTQTLQRL
jgi:hypothetical protein